MVIEDTLKNPQTVNYLLVGLMKRLESIESKLDKRVAYLLVEDAVGAYRQHLREKGYPPSET